MRVREVVSKIYPDLFNGEPDGGEVNTPSDSAPRLSLQVRYRLVQHALTLGAQRDQSGWRGVGKLWVSIPFGSGHHHSVECADTLRHDGRHDFSGTTAAFHPVACRPQRIPLKDTNYEVYLHCPTAIVIDNQQYAMGSLSTNVSGMLP